jgi:hypothetical protein
VVRVLAVEEGRVVAARPDTMGEAAIGCLEAKKMLVSASIAFAMAYKAM